MISQADADAIVRKIKEDNRRQAERAAQMLRHYCRQCRTQTTGERYCCRRCEERHRAGMAAWVQSQRRKQEERQAWERSR